MLLHWTNELSSAARGGWEWRALLHRKREGLARQNRLHMGSAGCFFKRSAAACSPVLHTVCVQKRSDRACLQVRVGDRFAWLVVSPLHHPGIRMDFHLIITHSESKLVDRSCGQAAQSNAFKHEQTLANADQ